MLASPVFAFPALLSSPIIRCETGIQSGDYALVARVEVECSVVVAQRSGERGVGVAAKACFRNGVSRPDANPGWYNGREG
jgi:hypothetical protein